LSARVTLSRVVLKSGKVVDGKQNIDIQN